MFIINIMFTSWNLLSWKLWSWSKKSEIGRRIFEWKKEDSQLKIYENHKQIKKFVWKDNKQKPLQMLIIIILIIIKENINL